MQCLKVHYVVFWGRLSDFVLHVADPAQWRFQGGQVGAGFCLEGRIQPGKKLQMPH